MSTGIAKYGIDYVVPGMLHAKFLRSPYANARVVSVDTTKAKLIPGVVDIVTWEDADIKNLSSGRGAAQPFLDNLADQEGAEVAVIVVAENEDICEEALRRLDVKWEVLPHVVDLLEGRKADAPVIRPAVAAPAGKEGGGGMGMPKSNNPPKKGNVAYSNMSEGDVEAGFREADHIIEYDLNIPTFAGHIPNRPGSVAWWFDDPYHGEGRSLQIEGTPWGHEQVGSLYRLPTEKVVRECMFVGGRYCDWGVRKSQLVTPMLARRTGRPVRCIDTRYEAYDFNLSQRFMHLKVGFKKNGLITAIDDFSIADAGVRGTTNFGNTMDQSDGPYFTTRCQNVKQSMEIVDSNRGKMYTSGQHNPMNWDSITMAIHLIAEKLGKDPMEIATLNLHGPTSQTDPDPVPSYEACLKSAKKLILEAAVEEANNPPGGGFRGSMGGPPPKQAPNPLKGLKPEDLDLQDGKVIVKADPGKSLPLAQAVRANLFATYSGRPPDAIWTTRGKKLDTMNVSMCEVAVDTETGQVEILRFGVAADPGKIMRRTSPEGQIHQVLDLNTGCQLQEDFYYDKATGVKLNTNMFDYKKTSMLDMPRVDMELLETQAGNACYGSNGISHSLANTHLVICAIQNAIGKWVDPPATPDKVLKALGKA